jgi:methylated-DNA-protein-cysteine methyltransferase related protein
MGEGSSGAPRPPGARIDPPAALTPFQRAVVDGVGSLRPGDVVTYAELAIEVGHPGSAQAVANVLRRVPGLPWWRVVPSDGRLYRTHAPVQAPLLRSEGVEVTDDRWVRPATGG